MRLHRGAKLFADYKYIAGSIVGEGMSADEIVAAIGRFGHLYTSAAPVAVPAVVGRAFTNSSDGWLGPYALDTAQSISVSPYADRGFVAPNRDPNFLIAINILLENEEETDHPAPAQYPPYLQVVVIPSGCVADTATKTYTWILGQSNEGPDGEMDPHRHATITLSGATLNCLTGDDSMTFSVRVKALISWTGLSRYKWRMMPNGILVVKQ